ncbi:MAG TPA: winged helix-turn-helix domain-containing protein, partial [Terriglobales bacterium]|nr:winged helix-turn-helix domain-containing protein [Terriglobales bacterium]
MRGNFHISDWEIQPQINCVTRGDRTFHLEPKVMQVLVYLASKPNEVLSKEELIHTVWADTFVGDDVLTRSISEIRRALEDDARAPKFIQTIPKVGYRLMVPVKYDIPAKVEPVTRTSAQAEETSAVAVVPGFNNKKIESQPADQNTKRWIVAVAAVAVLLGPLAFWGIRHARPAQESTLPESYKTVPFTSNLGAESQPAFSPDAKQIAFVWKREDEKFRHIYVKLIGAETQLQLTSGNADDFNPTWSPDGTSLAFLRLSGDDRGIYIVPAIGGAARKI